MTVEHPDRRAVARGRIVNIPTQTMYVDAYWQPAGEGRPMRPEAAVLLYRKPRPASPSLVGTEVQGFT